MRNVGEQQHTFDDAARFHQAGRLAEAERLYAQILDSNPRHFMARHMLGVLCLEQTRNDEALGHIHQALQINSQAPDALLHFGVALQAAGRRVEALKSYDQALAVRADYVSALYNRGNVLRELNEPLRAVSSYEEALKIAPEHMGSLYNMGVAFWALGRFADAVLIYDKVLRANPSHAEAHFNRGIALQELRLLPDALASYDSAVRLKPGLVGALNNRGVVLRELKRFDESLASFEQVLTIEQFHVEALNNYGILLHRLKRFEEACASYRNALAVQPRNVDVLYNQGMALAELGFLSDALTSYDFALEIRPQHVEAMYNRGVVQQNLKRFSEALSSYEKSQLAKPEHPYAFGCIAGCALHLCDWERTGLLAGELEARVGASKSVVAPLTFLGYSGDPALQRRCAENYLRDRIPDRPPPLWEGARYSHDRIRLAYLSADFHQHATAHLMAELFERHDRSRFEVIAISMGEDDASPMRARLVKAFDQFHDVHGKSDLETARFLRGLEVDIAVDLKGHTQGCRPELFSHRFAPVQVNYLGYPGTMGTDFIDYIVADATVAPMDQQAFFSEKIIHLPDCYQVNDSTRSIPDLTPSRTEMGLPEQGFVFCCFNNSWKITASMFDVWMRLLGAVPGSVLWLLQDSNDARRNLAAAAAVRGIAPARLVFAHRIEPDRHLARHRLADLFLDTLPYNAHTTASDALWAGLPLVTCMGQSFAGRVAASLLFAIGLPELVTTSLETYEALALDLAHNPARLTTLKDRLAANRTTHPLFDTDRLRCNIEAAYVRMHDIAKNGQKPQSFTVDSPSP